ncbi:MAG: hypothetical protein IJJ29_04125 [Solobacterium sp.]|nr:hypothetical protein [Solobacterium sp.]
MNIINQEITAGIPAGFAVSVILAVIGIIVYMKVGRHHKTSALILTILLLTAICAEAFFLPTASVIELIILIAAYVISEKSKDANVRKDDGSWINARKFTDDYTESDSGTGCYVITVFDKENVDNHAQGYEKAYVGSSHNISKEIYNVLTNKSISRAYEDLQEGKHAFVKVVPCTKENVNEMQERLIRMYDGIPYMISFKEAREKRMKKQ